MIGNLQLLRGYAALAVVLYHLGFTFGLPHGTDFKGVAIFFVISGFLMSGFAHQSPAMFLWRRLARIAPLYWVGTLLMVWLFGGWAWHDWRDVALSLAFVPHLDARGTWQPTLGVGWTLVLEMWFYLLFASAMALVGRRAPLFVAGLLVALVAVLQASESRNVWALYLGHLYNLHFVLGIALFYAMRSLGRPQIARSALWPVMPLAVAAAAAICLNERSVTVAYVTAYVVPPVLVGTAVWLARVGADTQSPWAMRIGDASYGIYLLHTIGIEWFRQKGIVLNESAGWSFAFVVALVAVSYAVFRLFEVPARTILTRPAGSPVAPAVS
ncbi:acyltransferase family protein [Salinarimonas soli]|uniref:Acyltransferase n=1 Tax=Salinarimonas soli TaxID=1638099 RepID=A0A5B2VGA3_9HYPH|nr:acyltransferase [Salinarimonas soli]KAA2237658.1 acyltransferase [Salinarimonas soli]